MVEFRVLGPLEVVRDGEPVAIGGLRRRAVLAMLVLEAGRVVSVDRLVDGVWGEEPPDTAVTALHGHVSHLRRALGDRLVTRAPGYVLEVEPDAVDAHRFEALLERARAATAAGDAAQAGRLLDEALALWRGAPLADLIDAPFAATALPRLEELGLSAREERIESELASGRAEELIPQLKALVAEHPLRERPRGQLMLALYRAGREAEALESYDAFRRTLSAELGIEPGEPLRRLHESILHRAPELGGPPPRPPRRDAEPERRRRRGPLLAAAVGVIAIAAVLVAISIGGDDAARGSVELRGSGVVRVDPDSLDVVTAVPLDGTPTSLTAAGDRAWVVDADGQTVSEVSARGRRARTFATGAVPTDVAAGDGALWVTEGRQGATQTLTPVTRTLAHLDARSNAVRGRTVLPASRGTVSAIPTDRLALSRAAVWAIAGDGSVVQVDPRSEEVVRVLPFPALAVTATPDRAWILTADRTLLPVAERGSATGIPIDVPGSDVASIAAGEGGVWVTDPTFGTVTRVDPAGPGAGRPFRVGAGIGPVAVGAGAVWVVDGPRRRLVRLDPSSGAISGEVALRGIPRDVAVSDDGVWVSVGSGSARASTSCTPTVEGEAKADVLLVGDLPLRGGARRPTGDMARAIGSVVRDHGHRAGRLRVGYRICDDSTAQAASFDRDRCIANARAHAEDRRVVIEVGPYQSGCAQWQLRAAAEAGRSRLPMVSPTNTAPDLTSNIRPTERVPYTRVIARDDVQAGAMAAELRSRGRTSVFVLDDAAGAATYGLDQASYFAQAARASGLRVAGRASWGKSGGARNLDRLARRVARSGADAVYVSGLLDNGAGAMIRALRRALPANVIVAGPELLLPISRLFERAGPAARDVLVSTTALPIAQMPAAGRALAARMARRLGVEAVHPYVVYAAQATEVAIDAIARSNGTRRSVARALFATDLPESLIGPVAFDPRGDLENAPVAIVVARRGGGSDQVLSTEGASFLAVRDNPPPVP